MKRKHLKQILPLMLLIIVVWGFINYINQDFNPAGEITVPAIEPSVTEVESLSVQLFVDGLYQDELVVIEAGETALSMLERINSESAELQLVTKDFGEMGVLVDAMGGRVNGTGNKYWQYEVNGVAPMIGANAYELEGGDSVVWEFKASEF